MIGIIGGTGLYQLEGLEVTERRWIDTPFGRPSGPVVLGRWQAHPVAFLARHGESHGLLPSEINYRANLLALKLAGARRLIGISAVGSLVDTIVPGSLALPAQYIDLTGGRRASTFFGNGLVAHVSTAEPTCVQLTAMLGNAAQALGLSVHQRSTYICVSGPRLGTRAESHHMRLLGGQLVGMTNVPEAFLAREAQLCYSSIAVVTDFDCWQEDPSLHVSVDQVLDVYRKSLARVHKLLSTVLSDISANVRSCSCGIALARAIITPRETLTAESRELLRLLEA